MLRIKIIFEQFFQMGSDPKLKGVKKERSAVHHILIDFSLTVKAATVIFISWCGLAISSAKQGQSGSIYNLEKN